MPASTYEMAQWGDDIALESHQHGQHHANDGLMGFVEKLERKIALPLAAPAPALVAAEKLTPRRRWRKMAQPGPMRNINDEVYQSLVRTVEELNRAQAEMEYRRELKIEAANLRAEGSLVEASIVEDVATGIMPAEVLDKLVFDRDEAEGAAESFDGRCRRNRLGGQVVEPRSIAPIIRQKHVTKRWGYFSSAAWLMPNQDSDQVKEHDETKKEAYVQMKEELMATIKEKPKKDPNRLSSWMLTVRQFKRERYFGRLDSLVKRSHGRIARVNRIHSAVVIQRHWRNYTGACKFTERQQMGLEAPDQAEEQERSHRQRDEAEGTLQVQESEDDEGDEFDEEYEGGESSDGAHSESYSRSRFSPLKERKLFLLKIAPRPEEEYSTLQGQGASLSSRGKVVKQSPRIGFGSVTAIGDRLAERAQGNDANPEVQPRSARGFKTLTLTGFLVDATATSGGSSYRLDHKDAPDGGSRVAHEAKGDSTSSLPDGEGAAWGKSPRGARQRGAASGTQRPSGGLAGLGHQGAVGGAGGLGGLGLQGGEGGAQGGQDRRAASQSNGLGGMLSHAGGGYSSKSSAQQQSNAHQHIGQKPVTAGPSAGVGAGVGAGADVDVEQEGSRGWGGLKSARETSHLRALHCAFEDGQSATPLCVNTDGQLVPMHRNEEGRWVQMQYDEAGELMPMQYNKDEEILPLTFNEGGQLVQMQYDEDGQLVPMKYRQVGQLVSVKYKEEEDLVPMQYNEKGQLVPMQYNQDGQLVPTQYNQDGQLVPMQYGKDGQLVPMEYNQDGQLVPMQYNQDGQLVPMQYNQDGQLVPMQDGKDGQVVPMQYNQDGQLIPMECNNQNASLDANGRPGITLNQPLGGKDASLDANGTPGITLNQPLGGKDVQCLTAPGGTQVAHAGLQGDGGRLSGGLSEEGLPVPTAGAKPVNPGPGVVKRQGDEIIHGDGDGDGGGDGDGDGDGEGRGVGAQPGGQVMQGGSDQQGGCNQLAGSKQQTGSDLQTRYSQQTISRQQAESEQQARLKQQAEAEQLARTKRVAIVVQRIKDAMSRAPLIPVRGNASLRFRLAKLASSRPTPVHLIREEDELDTNWQQSQAEEELAPEMPGGMHDINVLLAACMGTGSNTDRGAVKESMNVTKQVTQRMFPTGYYKVSDYIADQAMSSSYETRSPNPRVSAKRYSESNLKSYPGVVSSSTGQLDPFPSMSNAYTPIGGTQSTSAISHTHIPVNHSSSTSPSPPSDAFRSSSSSLYPPSRGSHSTSSSPYPPSGGSHSVSGANPRAVSIRPYAFAMGERDVANGRSSPGVGTVSHVAHVAHGRSSPDVGTVSHVAHVTHGRSSPDVGTVSGIADGAKSRGGLRGPGRLSRTVSYAALGTAAQSLTVRSTSKPQYAAIGDGERENSGYGGAMSEVMTAEMGLAFDALYDASKNCPAPPTSPCESLADEDPYQDVSIRHPTHPSYPLEVSCFSHAPSFQDMPDRRGGGGGGGGGARGGGGGGGGGARGRGGGGGGGGGNNSLSRAGSDYMGSLRGPTLSAPLSLLDSSISAIVIGQHGLLSHPSEPNVVARKDGPYPSNSSAPNLVISKDGPYNPSHSRSFRNVQKGRGPLALLQVPEGRSDVNTDAGLGQPSMPTPGLRHRLHAHVSGGGGGEGAPLGVYAVPPRSSLLLEVSAKSIRGGNLPAPITALAIGSWQQPAGGNLPAPIPASGISSKQQPAGRVHRKGFGAHGRWVVGRQTGKLGLQVPHRGSARPVSRMVVRPYMSQSRPPSGGGRHPTHLPPLGMLSHKEVDQRDLQLLELPSDPSDSECSLWASQASQGQTSQAGESSPRASQASQGQTGQAGESSPRASQGRQGQTSQADDSSPRASQGSQGQTSQADESSPRASQGQTSQAGESSPWASQASQGLTGQAGQPGESSYPTEVTSDSHDQVDLVAQVETPMPPKSDEMNMAEATGSSEHASAGSSARSASDAGGACVAGSDASAAGSAHGASGAGSEPSEARSEPSKAKPNEAMASKAKPSEAKPSEAMSSEAKPSEAKPSEAKPSEAMPSEGKPNEAKPSDAKPSHMSAPIQKLVEGALTSLDALPDICSPRAMSSELEICVSEPGPVLQAHHQADDMVQSTRRMSQYTPAPSNGDMAKGDALPGILSPHISDPGPALQAHHQADDMVNSARRMSQYTPAPSNGDMAKGDALPGRLSPHISDPGPALQAHHQADGVVQSTRRNLGVLVVASNMAPSFTTLPYLPPSPAKQASLAVRFGSLGAVGGGGGSIGGAPGPRGPRLPNILPNRPSDRRKSDGMVGLMYSQSTAKQRQDLAAMNRRHIAPELLPQGECPPLVAALNSQLYMPESRGPQIPSSRSVSSVGFSTYSDADRGSPLRHRRQQRLQVPPSMSKLKLASIDVLPGVRTDSGGGSPKRLTPSPPA